jgi:hypothetical protein
MKLNQVQTGVTVAQDQQNAGYIVPIGSLQATQVSSTTWSSASGSRYVVGQASDVANGFAQYTSINTAIAALSALSLTGKIRILPGTYTENVSVSIADLMLEGAGHSTYINGTLTLASNYGLVKYLRSGSITFSAATDGNRVTDTWLISGGTVTNSGGGGNHWDITGE